MPWKRFNASSSGAAGANRGSCGLQALRGDAVWKALEAGSWASGGWDPSAVRGLPLPQPHAHAGARGLYATSIPRRPTCARMVNEPVAYRFEYADGLKATMLLLNGLVGDITFAARLKGQAEPFSTLMWLGGGHDTQPNNFDPLVWHIEQFFLLRQTALSGRAHAADHGPGGRGRRIAVAQRRSGSKRRTWRSVTNPNPNSTFRRT